MHTTTRTRSVVGAALLGLLVAGGPVAAQTVGYFTDFTPGDTGPVSAIMANGFTPVAINSIGSFNFNSVNIVLIDTVPGGLSTDLASREADLASFVQNGGRLIINDASVTDNGILPGGSGVSLNPLGLFDPAASTVNVVTASPLTEGPFGHLSGTDLSNGNSSVNGYADSATLPVGSVNLLADGNGAGQSVAFDYSYGRGSVLYTAVPLDFYFNSPFASDPPKSSIVNVFAPNELYLASVPEPGFNTLLVTSGLAGAGAIRRRRRK